MPVRVDNCLYWYTFLRKALNSISFFSYIYKLIVVEKVVSLSEPGAFCYYNFLVFETASSCWHLYNIGLLLLNKWVVKAVIVLQQHELFSQFVLCVDKDRPLKIYGCVFRFIA